MPISQITGASIQDGSIVVADLGITTFNTGTGNTLTLQANSATGLVISVTGNTAIANSLSFSSTGARITGDFSNGTIVNRVLFQSNTTNGITVVTAIPNGTATDARFSVNNNSDPTNSSGIQILANATEARLQATNFGTGPAFPLTMYTNGSERLRIDTSGNVGIGTNNPSSAKLHIVGDWVSGNSTVKVQTTTSFASGGQAGYGTYDSNGTRIGLLYSYVSGTVLGTSTASPLSFETNGVERARIDSAGRIGIGTTSPSQRLHVAAGTILASNTSSTTATVSIAGNGSTTGTSDFSLQQGTSSEAYVFNRANSFLVIGTNNTERMRITSGGNVGIGVTDPSFLTEIVGGSNTVETTLFQIRSNHTGTNTGTTIALANSTNPTAGSGRVELAALRNTASGSAFVIRTAGSDGNVAERMRIDTNGNVGIGTAPVSNFRLSVNSSSGDFIGYFINTNIGTDAKGINVTGYADNGGTKYDWSNGATLYLSNDRFQTSGIVSKIVMNTANGGYNNGAIIHVEGAGAYNQGQLVFSTGWNASNLATERMRITTGGQLCLNTTTKLNSDARLHIAYDGAGENAIIIKNTGTFNAYTVNFINASNVSAGGIYNNSSSSVSYVTSSDYRLKENVQPMTGALAKIGQLKPCTYKWKLDGSNGQGFIAHELQAVVPECVTGEKDAIDKDGNIKPQGVDTSFLVATLTAAIQEQQAIIESLTARIETLEKN